MSRLLRVNRIRRLRFSVGSFMICVYSDFSLLICEEPLSDWITQLICTDANLQLSYLIFRRHQSNFVVPRSRFARDPSIELLDIHRCYPSLVRGNCQTGPAFWLKWSWWGSGANEVRTMTGSARSRHGRTFGFGRWGRRYVDKGYWGGLLFSRGSDWSIRTNRSVWANRRHCIVFKGLAKPVTH